MIRVENDGSVWIFLLETPDELAWVKANLPLEPWQWTGPRSFAVDALPASTLVLQLRDEGLDVRAENQREMDDDGNCIVCRRYGSPSEGNCACPRKVLS